MLRLCWLLWTRCRWRRGQLKRVLNSVRAEPVEALAIWPKARQPIDCGSVTIEHYDR
jgi:hypothetical protein